MASGTLIDNWEIIPNAGVGPLRFGAARSEIRAILGGDYKEFKKGPYARTLTDAYRTLGLHLEYDEHDRLACIEAFDSCAIHYKNVFLLNRGIQDVSNDLQELGLVFRYDDGYFFDAAGFALFVLDNVVKAVTVYRRGYYDKDSCPTTHETGKNK